MSKFKVMLVGGADALVGRLCHWCPPTALRFVAAGFGCSQLPKEAGENQRVGSILGMLARLRERVIA